MSNKKSKPQFTFEELEHIRSMVDYFVETIAHDLASPGYRHPVDVQAWGQDITKYGIILEKISKLKGSK